MRDAGADSARLASALMQLSASALVRLELDDELREDIERARAVTALSARRRAERNLAGVLRSVDLVDLARRLENVRTTGVSDPGRFHHAERWRTRLVEDEAAAAAFRAAYPHADHARLPALIEGARRERDTGKPPGAARALFRHVNAILAEPSPAGDADAPADAADAPAGDAPADADHG